jgi:hypothetical protein
VVTALALGHHQRPVRDLHVSEPQAQHLAPAQPGQQHRSIIARSRCVRKATTSRSASAGDKIRGNVRGTRAWSGWLPKVSNMNQSRLTRTVSGT